MNATAPFEVFHIHGQLRANCCRGCDEGSYSQSGGRHSHRMTGYTILSGSFPAGAIFSDYDMEYTLRYHNFTEGDRIQHNSDGQVFEVYGKENQRLMEVRDEITT